MLQDKTTTEDEVWIVNNSKACDPPARVSDDTTELFLAVCQIGDEFQQFPKIEWSLVDEDSDNDTPVPHQVVNNLLEVESSRFGKRGLVRSSAIASSLDNLESQPLRKRRCVTFVGYI